MRAASESHLSSEGEAVPHETRSIPGFPVFSGAVLRPGRALQCAPAIGATGNSPGLLQGLRCDRLRCRVKLVEPAVGRELKQRQRHSPSMSSAFTILTAPIPNSRVPPGSPGEPVADEPARQAADGHGDNGACQTGRTASLAIDYMIHEAKSIAFAPRGTN